MNKKQIQDFINEFYDKEWINSKTGFFSHYYEAYNELLTFIEELDETKTYILMASEI